MQAKTNEGSPVMLAPSCRLVANPRHWGASEVYAASPQFNTGPTILHSLPVLVLATSRLVHAG